MEKETRITAPPPPPANQKVRTFSMTIKDVVQSADVVAGTLPVNSLGTKVLIDSGATRSFTSKAVVDKLLVKCNH